MAVAAVVVIAGFGLGAYLTFEFGGFNGNSSSTTTSSTTSVIQGIVTGYVTAGPSQPVCSANQSCYEDMSAYKVIFVAQCGEASGCLTEMADMNPAGHYSVLLPPGDYSVTGLSPSCPWLGCSSVFPESVTVEGGMQVVLNINIDTGIR